MFQINSGPPTYSFSILFLGGNWWMTQGPMKPLVVQNTGHQMIRDCAFLGSHKGLCLSAVVLTH